jgi:hypothetical protein
VINVGGLGKSNIDRTYGSNRKILVKIRKKKNRRYGSRYRGAMGRMKQVRNSFELLYPNIAPPGCHANLRNKLGFLILDWVKLTKFGKGY